MFKTTILIYNYNFRCLISGYCTLQNLGFKNSRGSNADYLGNRTYCPVYGTKVKISFSPTPYEFLFWEIFFIPIFKVRHEKFKKEILHFSKYSRT